MIGRHYVKDTYNCAHFVADWYREKLNVDVPTDNVFDRRFVIWLRKHFDQVDGSPMDHDLALMVNTDGTYHIGVYYENGVLHNFQRNINSNGSVCKWTLGTVMTYYNQVRFYRWSQ